MAGVLTEGSTVKCSHSGSVQLKAGQSHLKVGGKAVLIKGDLASSPISSCSTTLVTATPPSSPCLLTTSANGGEATKLKVGGVAVLLESVNGETSGIVAGTAQQTWSVTDVGQTKLKAT
jgi:hypothetical protein